MDFSGKITGKKGGKMGKADIECLEWIWARLVNFYNEKPNVDYMRRFSGVIASAKKASNE